MLTTTATTAMTLMADMCGFPEQARGMEAMIKMLKALDEKDFAAMSEDDAADWVSQFLPYPPPPRPKVQEPEHSEGEDPAQTASSPKKATFKRAHAKHQSYMRLGASTALTREEIALLRPGDDTSKEIMLQLFRTGRIQLDGLVSFSKAMNVFSADFAFDKDDGRTLYVT